MRTRKVIALSLISAGAALLFSGCPAQPPGPCVVARAFASAIEGTTPGFPYVVQYYFKDETAGCTDPAYAAWPTGNFVGGVWSEAYGPVTAVNKLVGWVPEEFGYTNSYPDLNANGLQDYVECTPLNNVLYATPCTHDPISYGNFTTDTEDSANTCTVLQTDAGTQLIGNVLVTYSYTKTLVYTNAAAGEGTQIQADVTIVRASQTPGTPSCVRDYTGIGLWPVILCNVDNDCNPNPQPSITPPRPIGSGLLPGIPYTCNAGLVGQDFVSVPGDVLANDWGCGDGVTAQPFLPLTLGCGGGAKDNNGTGGTSICFFASPSATQFPYVTQ